MTEPMGLQDEERADLLLRAYFEFRRELEGKGTVPREEKNVLTRFRGVFEFVGALQLGLLTACFTILLNFVIVVMFLHLDLSRYAGFFFFPV